MFEMFKFCSTYIKKYKYYFILYYSFIVLGGIFSLLVPLLNGKIIDYIVSNQTKIFYKTIICFLIINLLIITINFVRNRIYIKIQTNTAFDIISTLINHIQKLPISIIDDFDIGYLNQKINNDSNSVTTFVIDLVGNLTTSIITMIFSVYILINMNYIIGLIMLGIGCVYIFIYVLLKKLIYSISFKLKEEQAIFFSAMLMQLKDIKFIKIHSLINEYQKKMNSSYYHYYERVVKSQNFFFIYSSLDSFITVIANIFVFAMGGNMVMNKDLSIGEFTVILSYFNFIINAFRYFSALGKDYQDNKVSYKRLIELLDLKKQSDGSMLITKINSVSCNNLTFIRNNKNLFKDFNYTFTKGNSYCVCGRNGRGKTTLLETIIGMHRDEYSGQILYDNIDIKDINMCSLRHSNISIMEQHLVLLKGSTEENILLSEKHSLNNINNLIGGGGKNVEKYLMSLGKIKSDGGGISGGESQKLGLFRLFAKDADLYILDEPTASLDNKNIEKFMKYINDIKQDKIVIIISHDSTTINMCDYIINL